MAKDLIRVHLCDLWAFRAGGKKATRYSTPPPKILRLGPWGLAQDDSEDRAVGGGNSKLRIQNSKFNIQDSR